MSLFYVYVFLQSNLLEVPFYFLFFRKRVKALEALVVVTAINSITHPLVFFAFMNMKQTYLFNILVSEIFAVAVESFFFLRVLKIGFFKAFAAALVANLASWQLAPILTYLFWE